MISCSRSSDVRSVDSRSGIIEKMLAAVYTVVVSARGVRVDGGSCGNERVHVGDGDHHARATCSQRDGDRELIEIAG